MFLKRTSSRAEKEEKGWRNRGSVTQTNSPAYIGIFPPIQDKEKMCGMTSIFAPAGKLPTDTKNYVRVETPKITQERKKQMTVIMSREKQTVTEIKSSEKNKQRLK